jgi:hypothetical protein
MSNGMHAATERRSGSLLAFGWLLLGAVGGVVATRWSMPAPLHASASDHAQSFALATGALDEELEAVFFLDFTTGELTANVLSPINRHFYASYHTNVVRDLRIDVSRNPQFSIVTGNAAFRPGGGQVQPGNSIVYVAELTSGKLAAYAVPWPRNLANTGVPINNARLALLDVKQVRAGVSVEQE